MSNQQKEIIEINEYLVKWIYEIQISNSNTYYDINKIAEGFCLRLLNLIYGFELEDLNKEQINFPGIDLGDSVSSKVAFQITSDSRLRKIRESLEKFERCNYKERFPAGIRFLLLKSEKKRFRKIDDYREIFNQKTDILFPSDLLKEIENIFLDDYPRFLKIKKLLQLKIGNLKRSEESIIFHHDSEKIGQYLKGVRAVFPSPEKTVYLFLGEDQTLYDAHMMFALPFKSGGKIITGKSGSGKSLLAKAWALHLCNDIVPMVLEAKYFEKGLIRKIDAEVEKYGFGSSYTFLEACRNEGKKILLVVDGLNECDDSQAEIVVSELAELAALHSIMFIITSQQLTQSLKNLEAEVIGMELPNIQIKTAIASKYSLYTNKLEPLLANVSTAMEAKMVGEIGEIGADKISRYSLFEMYIRKKLYGIETQALHFLSATAYWMSCEITFSLSLAQLTKIMQQWNIPDAVFHRCIEEGLLVKNFTKVSFEHEMIFNFFTANAVTRFNNGTDKVIEEFNAPINDENRLLIVGSVDDNPVLRNSLLESITDYELLLDILEGEAGDYCRLWVEQKLSLVLEKMRFEVHTISFAVTEKPDWPIAVIPESISDWTEMDIPIFQVLGYKLMKGELVREVFDLIEMIDKRRNEHHNLLLSEASVRKINLKNGLFAAVYTASEYLVNMSGIGYILYMLNSGLYIFKNVKAISDQQIQDLLYPRITFGQLYFFLKLYRFKGNTGLLYPAIHSSLQSVWKLIPYHLKLEILFIAPFCADDEKQRLSLIEALNKIHSETQNIWLSTAVFDALHDLEALDEDAIAYKESVSDEISKLIQEPEREEFWEEAFHIFLAQFDHPYSRAYYETLEELNEKAKKTLFTMALRSKSDDMIFSSGLIFTCENMLGKECCMYLDHYLLRPLSVSNVSYDIVKNALAALSVLAKYNYDIVSYDFDRQSNDQNVNLVVMGTQMYYWINRTDLTEEQKRIKCIPIIRQFLAAEPFLFVYVFKQLDFSFLQIHFPENFSDTHSLVRVNDFFSNELLEASRKSLLLPLPHINLKFEKSDDILRFAVDKIGLYGGAVDIPELQKAAAHPVFGKAALVALRTIRERL
ncbi:SMEK domain-containing protein [Flavobacterium sp. ov086]|uniref:SMEK domain-containing protein n=1 Tax=Flavobacterium sp. ov086 TaxID=1761785 RepID=UPI000B6504BE|nr:SMEK domain-containing protein [Flavobacterium sp. ov086]SNR97728.1 hypothetical protein SAMN04487979_13711 [Flavobacterium sp. ov086]